MKRAPAHLSRKAKRLWKTICNDFQNFDKYALLILETALQAHDRLEQAREIIDREGLTITNPTSGNTRANPALQIEKDSRQAFLSAMRLLGLNIEPPGPIGRPPGS